MENEHGETAIADLRRPSEVRFMRGLIFGVAASVMLWAGIALAVAGFILKVL